MKKIALFTVAVLALGAVVVPVSASALTAQEIIDALTADPTLFAALQAALGGGVTTGGAASGTSLAAVQAINTDLTIGSKGADVTTLQTWLVEEGYLVMPVGVPMGYFGTLTQKALAQFQAENAITPAAGYFGPKTRGVIATLVSVPIVPSTGLPEGCASTSGFSATTGQPCTSTTLPAGCTSTTLYSPTTGQPCNSTTPVVPGTSVNEEGSITTKLASMPVPDANIRTMTNVPVYGIEVTAVGSDMSVDRVDLQVSVTPTGGSAQNPGSFIKKIAFYDGDTLLKEQSVVNIDFTKDSSDRYHVIVTGIGFKVPKGTVNVLTAKFDVTSLNTTDATRVVAVQGYAGNSNNVRAVDTAGLQSYTDMSGAANARSHTFTAAGDSTVTGSINTANTPDSTNWKVGTSAGVEKMPILAFDVKSETGDSKITKLYVQVNATATAGIPDTLFLYEEGGSEILGTVDTSALTDGQQTGFTSLSIPVAKDATKKLVLKATFPTTANGQAASTSIPVNGIQWEKPDGSTASTTPSSALASNHQYMYGAVPKWTLEDKSAVAVTDSGSASATTTITYKLKLKLTGDGGSTVKPVITTEAIRDFNVYLSSSTASTYTVSNNALLLLPANSTSTLTLDELSPSDATVGDGGSYTMTIVGNLVNKTAAGAYTTQAGNYFMVTQRASSTVGGNNVVQTWGFDDFRTPSVWVPGS